MLGLARWKFSAIPEETSWELARVLFGGRLRYYNGIGHPLVFSFTELELIPCPTDVPSFHSYQLKLGICKKQEGKIVEPCFGLKVDVRVGRFEQEDSGKEVGCWRDREKYERRSFQMGHSPYKGSAQEDILSFLVGRNN